MLSQIIEKIVTNNPQITHTSEITLEMLIPLTPTERQHLINLDGPMLDERFAKAAIQHRFDKRMSEQYAIFASGHLAGESYDHVRIITTNENAEVLYQAWKEWAKNVENWISGPSIMSYWAKDTHWNGFQRTLTPVYEELKPYFFPQA